MKVTASITNDKSVVGSFRGPCKEMGVTIETPEGTIQLNVDKKTAAKLSHLFTRLATTK